MKKYIFIILVIFLLAAPVSANITYPHEYYTLGEQTNISWHKISRAYFGSGQEYPTAEYLTFLELRRQTILMEKQNELQAELVKAQWVDTCYASENTVTMGNRSAWKSECANVGYPVG